MSIKSNVLMSVSSLSIGFTKPIVSNLNFKIDSNKFIILLGKNGVGKSCLLKTISGLIPYQEGSVKVLNSELKDINRIDLAQKISVLLTDKVSVEFLLVEDLIATARSPYTNWNDEFQKEDCEIISNTVKLLGIENLMGKYFSQLSDGQKQKVLLCRAIAQSPKILILDEPTTYLDIPSKVDFLKSVKKIVIENHLSVVMSTHDHLLMKELVDEVWFLKDNELLIYTPEELISSGVFEKEFGLNLN